MLNGQLKIDGFEHAVKLDSNDSVVDVNDEEKYGMYNAPELNKHRKINQKYHIWYVQLSCILYKLAYSFLMPKSPILCTFGFTKGNSAGS